VTHYLLFYEAADDYVAKRAKFRNAHLAKAWRASQRGELLLAGALAHPIDGAVLLFKGDSPAVAEDFARADPYVTGGAVTRWYVREWTTVVGDQASTPVTPDRAGGERNSVAPTSAVDNSNTPAGERPPILRMWRGRASVEKAGDYLRHVTQKVFPQLESIAGYRGAQVLRRSVSGGIELLVLTLWESMDAVRRFAGAQPEKAVVEPAARALLSDHDETAVHFEVVHSSGMPPPSNEFEAAGTRPPLTD